MNRDEDFANLVPDMGQEDLEEDGDGLEVVEELGLTTLGDFQDSQAGLDETKPTDEELREIEEQIDSELKDDNLPASPDALSAYFKLINECGKKLLSPQEEIHWAEVMRGEAKGDPKEARRILIESNLRLVINIAKKYLHRGIEFEDLIQEGNEGLIKGIDKFDPARGYRVSTYAAWRIRQMITRAIDDKARTIRIPFHLSSTKRIIKGTIGYLKRKKGIENPSFNQIAEFTGISVERMKEALDAPTNVISLETPVGDEDGDRLGDFIVDTKISKPDETSERIGDRKRILKLLHSLTPPEEKVMMCRIGLSTEPETFGRDGADYTLKEVGAKPDINLSKARIQQIESKALRRLRHSSRKDNIKVDLGLEDPKSTPRGTKKNSA